jgi:hypothetical protein
MKMFEVGYKSYYREFSEWCTDLIKARTEQAALRKFAKLHRIEKPDPKKAQDWKWWDGDWFMAFRYVKPVKLQTCPCCRGQGEVTVA